MKEVTDKPKHTFFVVSKHSKEPVRDFQQILEYLNRNWDLNIVQSTPVSASISNNMGYSTSFELQKQHPLLEKGFRICIKLVITIEDETTFQSIRSALLNSRWTYQIYSDRLQTFIPQSLEIVVDEVGDYNIEIHRIFSKFGLEPLYYHKQKSVYYALKEDTKEVVIVNRALLNFIFEKEIPEKKLDELYYVVAPSAQKFGYMFDRNLIPTDFYTYYKRDHKIINESHFNLNNPGRKVFIKPYIMELQEDRNEFYTYAGDGSSLLFMDKIRKGETLDKAILRVLKHELGISNDYIGAYVTKEVEFDRDRDGVITPRLVVMVYVEKITNKEWSLKMSQTSWRSVDGSLPSKN